MMGRFRAHYWSCSTFADKIRRLFGCKSKPNSATLEDWETWYNTNEQISPFCMWLTEKFLNKIQNALHSPLDVINDCSFYIRNRFVNRTHYCATSLTPGQYHEIDTRILNGMFETLVDYVEIEMARSFNAWNQLIPTNRPLCYRWTKWRDPDSGIKKLEWEMSLVYTEEDGIDPSNPIFGTSTEQAKGAAEIYFLYKWWTSLRSSRGEGTTYDEREAMHAWYSNEDTAMAIRLIKMRASLWT